MTATIGGVPMTDIGPVFSFFFDAKTPALPGGVYDVTVTNPRPDRDHSQGLDRGVPGCAAEPSVLSTSSRS